MKAAWVDRIARERRNRGKWLIEYYEPTFERWMRANAYVMFTVIDGALLPAGVRTLKKRQRHPLYTMDELMRQLPALRDRFKQTTYRARQYTTGIIIMADIL